MFVNFKFQFNSIVTEESKDDKTTLNWVIPKETYQKLRELIEELPEEPTLGIYWTTYTAHIESLLNIFAKIEIKEVLKTKGYHDIHECIARINQNLDNMECKIKRNQEHLFNSKVEVHVPGNALLEINEIIYKVDCCTDKLSNLLSEGWRIVAVCPQPDQRRPDYILGRVNVT